MSDEGRRGACAGRGRPRGASQRAGGIRDDLPAGRLTDWIMVLLDGFLGRISGEQFDPVAERDMLLDTARRLIAP